MANYPIVQQHDKVDISTAYKLFDRYDLNSQMRVVVSFGLWLRLLIEPGGVIDQIHIIVQCHQWFHFLVGDLRVVF